MTIIWSGLTPHPPIIVASVGGRRCSQVEKTITSMQLLARDMLAHRPDRLVLISPHTPRPREGIGLWLEGNLVGDFGPFGAPQTKISLPLDNSWVDSFRSFYPQATPLRENLDHGALVPLHFMAEAGWHGPTAVVGLPWAEDGTLEEIGSAIAAACRDDRRTALIASGDMSHSLLPEAPCGFDECGPQFDDAFVAHVREARFKEAAAIASPVRERAHEDVVGSCRVAWRADDYNASHHHFYSYEGPFGVGYTVMKFRGEAL